MNLASLAARLMRLPTEFRSGAFILEVDTLVLGHGSGDIRVIYARAWNGQQLRYCFAFIVNIVMKVPQDLQHLVSKLRNTHGYQWVY